MNCKNSLNVKAEKIPFRNYALFLLKKVAKYFRKLKF